METSSWARPCKPTILTMSFPGKPCLKAGWATAQWLNIQEFAGNCLSPKAMYTIRHLCLCISVDGKMRQFLRFWNHSQKDDSIFGSIPWWISCCSLQMLAYLEWSRLQISHPVQILCDFKDGFWNCPLRMVDWPVFCMSPKFSVDPTKCWSELRFCKQSMATGCGLCHDLWYQTLCQRHVVSRIKGWILFRFSYQDSSLAWSARAPQWTARIPQLLSLNSLAVCDTGGISPCQRLQKNWWESRERMEGRQSK